MRDLIRQAAKRVPLVTEAYRRWRDLRWASVPPQPTPHGFLLTGQAEMMAGLFEPEETRLVRTLLRSCDRLVNVGANVGYYVCHAIGLGRPVLAVEPLQRNLRYLLANVRANQAIQPVEILPVALAEAPGILELFGSGTAASLIRGWAQGASRGGQLTPVLTLDALVAHRFPGERLLILIDVEGVEERVLMGAEQTLARVPVPVFLVEISFGEHLGLRNDRLLPTFARFLDRGYRAWAAVRDPVPVERADIEAVAAGGPNPFNTQNFLFAEPAVDVPALLARYGDA